MDILSEPNEVFFWGRTFKIAWLSAGKPIQVERQDAISTLVDLGWNTLYGSGVASGQQELPRVKAAFQRRERGAGLASRLKKANVPASSG